MNVFTTVWTGSALHVELRKAGYDVGKTQFYSWLKYALIKGKSEGGMVLYSDRDRAKLMKFAEFRKRLPQTPLKTTRELLRLDLQEHPGDYPE